MSVTGDGRPHYLDIKTLLPAAATALTATATPPLGHYSQDGSLSLERGAGHTPSYSQSRDGISKQGTGRALEKLKKATAVEISADIMC